MEGCVFCEIVAGKRFASRVCEDEHTLAFMNLRQANPGHVLVIPKTHLETIYAMNDTQTAHLFQTVLRVSRAIRKSIKPEGLSLFQANGEASYQEIFHVHVHLLPRRNNDGLLRYYPELPPYQERAELDRLAGLIRDELE